MSNFIGNCFLQWFLIEIVTGQMPAAKYIMGNMPPVRSNVPLPSVPTPMSYPTNPTISSLLNTYLPNNLNVPNLQPFTNFPSTPTMMNSQPMSSLGFSLPTSPSMKLPMPQPNAFDSTAMNNLAVALQLLILTNLLHPSESEPQKPPAVDSNPQTSTHTYYQNPQPPQNPAPYPNQPTVQYVSEPQEVQPIIPPNSKFLSSSDFAEPSMSPLMGAPAAGCNWGYGNPQNSASRNNNYSLMSPYEALGPGPQMKDVFAQYGPQNLKADFQSPYNSIMAHDNTSKDLFDMF